MASKWAVWTIEHIYFVNDETVLDFKVNRQIPKYNQQQIESALKEYEHAKGGNTDANMKNSRQTIYKYYFRQSESQDILNIIKEKIRYSFRRNERMVQR
jgi:hypothetical protein